jgi:hypothetical protein
MHSRVALFAATTALALSPAAFAASNLQQAFNLARSSGKPLLAIAGHEG